MSEKENRKSIIDIKTVIISLFLALGLYSLFCFIWTILIKVGIVSFNLVGIFSKISFLAASIISCHYARKKGRGELFVNCLSSAVLFFALAILISSMFEGREWNTAGAIICLLISILSCFLMLMPKKKNSRLHKRKRTR